MRRSAKTFIRTTTSSGASGPHLSVARSFLRFSPTDQIVISPPSLAIRQFIGRPDLDVSWEQLDRVAVDAFTGPTPTWPYKNLVQVAFGAPMRELVDMSNDPRFRTAVVPAGNIIATPEEISRFFETLLCGGTYEDTRVFDQRTVARATEPQVTGQVDRVLMMPIPLSMGFMLGGRTFGFYGPRTGDAFGHLGFTNVLGWADPDRDISVAFMNTGKPLRSAKMLTWLNVTRVIQCRIINSPRPQGFARFSSATGSATAWASKPDPSSRIETTTWYCDKTTLR